MRIRLAIPDRHVNAYTLEGALEAVTRAAEHEIRSGAAPDIRELIEARAVRWKPEAYADGEHFDLPSVVAARRWGDCDDLAPALAASLRASGEDPGATATAYKSGPRTWHCVVRTSDGQILDPSRWAGMRRAGRGVSGAQIDPMSHQGDGAIAVVRDGRRWAARCDLPWPNSPGHFAALGRGANPSQAMARAVIGAAMCGHAIGASDVAAHAEELADRVLPLTDELPHAIERGRVYRESLPGVARLVYQPGSRRPLVLRF